MKNFSIGSPIDFQRVEESLGGRSVFVGMLGSFLDCFQDNNSPLEIAEIELTEEKEEVTLPSFLSREITGLKVFSNLSLTKHPFSKWKNKDLTILKRN